MQKCNKVANILISRRATYHYFQSKEINWYTIFILTILNNCPRGAAKTTIKEAMKFFKRSQSDKQFIAQLEAIQSKDLITIATRNPTRYKCTVTGLNTLQDVEQLLKKTKIQTYK